MPALYASLDMRGAAFFQEAMPMCLLEAMAAAKAGNRHDSWSYSQS